MPAAIGFRFFLPEGYAAVQNKGTPIYHHHAYLVPGVPVAPIAAVFAPGPHFLGDAVSHLELELEKGTRHCRSRALRRRPRCHSKVSDPKVINTLKVFRRLADQLDYQRRPLHTLKPCPVS
jgi:hypothetical protein